MSNATRLCLAAMTLVLALLSASCSSPAKNEKPKALRVLCGTFPMYVFTRNVTEGRAEVQVDLMLPAAQGCPHDYELSAQDMRKISQADVFVANGLGMEAFLGKPLRTANPHVKLIDTSKSIPGVTTMMDEGQVESNPHLFASPRKAARIVMNIATELGRIDPAGKDLYLKNATAYAARLNKIADEFVATVKTLRSNKIVTEHAVFDYLAADCGLEVVATVEESPGQSPSAGQMLKIINTIRDKNAAAVFTEPQYPAKIGRKIAEETHLPVAVLDPVASGPDNPPLDYYETTMQANRKTLLSTLGLKEN